MQIFPRFRAVLILLIVFPLTGCLFRSRRVERQLSTAPLKSATQAELIDYINSEAAKIKTLQATVDIDTSVGGMKKGKVTNYQKIRGDTLGPKPPLLRVCGLWALVRTRD